MLAQAIGVQPNGVQQAPPTKNKMSQELVQTLLALLKMLTEFDGSLNQFRKLGSVKSGIGVLDETLESLIKHFKHETESSKKNTLKKLLKEFKQIEELLQALKGLGVILMALSSSKETSTNEGISSLLEGNNSSPLDDILDTSLQKAVENTDNF